MIPIIMPRQGQSVESCIITKWHKKAGDVVSVGELLFSYETDKAAFDEEAKDEGVLLSILRDEGDDVPCLETVCFIGEAGEDASGFSAAEPPVVSTSSGGQPSAAASSVADAEVKADAEGISDEQQAAAYQIRSISPRARALAKKSGADLSLVSPSGPFGRVIARDVEALIDAGKVVTRAARVVAPEGIQGTGLGGRVALRDLEQATPALPDVERASAEIIPQAASVAPVVSVAPVLSRGTVLTEPVLSAEPILLAEPILPAATEQHPAYHDEPLSNIRKRIAKTMQVSISTMAQLTHTVTYDATNVVQMRKQLKEQGKPFGMDGVTLGDLVVFGTVRTLMQPEHAHLNAHFLNDTIRYFHNVHLGVAVDTARGLMVPTLRFANRKSLLEISTEIKALAAACQSGAIDPDLLVGGSFTVSNLGAFEIEHFTPIINPPQTGVLGVNTLQQRVREKNGQIEVYPAMSLSLTYDHRALDGAPASRFLRDLKRNLENIQMLMGGGVYRV